MIDSFEYLGIHVEIHFNGFWKKYFWVTGHSGDRWFGPCEYFSDVDECRNDVKKELELHHNANRNNVR